jgi:hypothetical protein
MKSRGTNSQVLTGIHSRFWGYRVNRRPLRASRNPGLTCSPYGDIHECGGIVVRTGQGTHSTQVDDCSFSENPRRLSDVGTGHRGMIRNRRGIAMFPKAPKGNRHGVEVGMSVAIRIC